MLRSGMRVLAGDIGGTNTRLALYEHTGDDGGFVELRRKTYSSRSFHGLTPILRLFVEEDTCGVDAAAFGVAGPVVDNRCTATNLPWKIDGDHIGLELGIERLQIINDFHALALGVLELGESDLSVLQEAPVDTGAPIAILGAGTGLGQAILLRDPSGPRILPTEGGHTDFAPRNEEEMKLLRFLLDRHERVSYERVLSGPGLMTLFEFVTTTGIAKEQAETRERMTSEDPGAVIGQSAIEGSDDACVHAVRMFCALYGAEAGNLALKTLPYGGVFVAGGIAPKLLPMLRENDTFMRAFKHKGRMSPLLANMRVSVVTHKHVGLLGARSKAIALHSS